MCTICASGTYGLLWCARYLSKLYFIHKSIFWIRVMEIVIDIEGTEPLFAQLIAQIKKSVSDGFINPGDPLPSIRQLANDLDINNKTVAKAYKLLERDSIIQAKGYRGTFVHPDAKENCEVDLSEWIEERLNKTIGELKSAGATDSEIRVAFANIMNSRN